MKSGMDSPLIESDEEELVSDVTEDELRSLLLLMSVAVGINHAAVTTPIGYASTVLEPKIGDYANAILFGTSICYSLFGAPLTMMCLGPKRGLILGMSAYTAYVFCFAAACMACRVQVFSEEQCEVGGPVQWGWATVGSLLGGIGAGLLWPCQGALFAHLSQAMSSIRADVSQTRGAEALQDAAARDTSELSSTFAVIFLSFEFVQKALFSMLQSLGMPAYLVFEIYGGLALLATLMFATYFRIRSMVFLVRQVSYSFEDGRDQKIPLSTDLVDVLKLWLDPKLPLLMFTNLTFGLSAAWVNGYVNATFLAEAVSSKHLIGALGALTAVVAAICSKACGVLASKYGKTPVIFFGAGCFFLIGALSQITWPHGKGPGGWGLGILLFYLLQGCGRGVYESTNKGLFADFFPGERAIPAFTNVMVQSSLSAAISFMLLDANQIQLSLYGLLLCAALTFPCLVIATRLQRREQKISHSTLPYN